MLSRLEIRDFALIESAVIDLKEGFTVLSGETGAGKSILIDAIGAICGDRTSRELVRTGCEVSVITAVFEDTNNQITNDELSAAGIENDDDTLIVSREIYSNGKSFARINGRIITSSVLKKTLSKLVDIHGQNDNQSLFSPETQLVLIDRFGSADIDKHAVDYSIHLNEYKKIREEMKLFITDPDKREKVLDLLRYQIREIHDAGIGPDEDIRLSEERKMIAGAEKIRSTLDFVQKALNGDDSLTAIPAVKESAHRITSQLSSYAGLSDIGDSLNDIAYKLEDINSEISDRLDKIDTDPRRLEMIERRIDLIEDLKHKYGGSITSVKAYYDKALEKLEDIIRSEDRLTELDNCRKEAEIKLKTASSGLYTARLRTACVLETAVSKELEDLGMKGTVFKVSIVHSDKDGDYRISGQDAAEFLISPNVGEDLKPLSRIASGGESSRIMLAIKTILADIDRIPVLIFDEIDTGISGHTGNLLADKLVRISRNHQVLCVTHMAQIAARARNHLKVEKTVDSGRTYTTVCRLSGSERAAEIARLLSGGTSNVKAMALANEMLKSSGSQDL